MKKQTVAPAPARKSARVETVDDYLAAVPEDSRKALERLRKTIRAAAPKATEVISYQIPAYKQHGLLVGFAASREHLTFHLMSTSLMRARDDELKDYNTGKASIQFQAGKPLPASLVTRLVKARIAENESGRSYRNRE